MKNYTHYEVEDFFLDDDFIEWVRKPSQEKNTFWHAWLEQHSDRAEVVQQARMLILSLRVAPGQDLTDEEVNELVAGVPIPEKSPQRTNEVNATPWYLQRWIRLTASIVILLGIGWGLSRSGFLAGYRTAHIAGSTLERTNTTPNSMLIRLSDGSSVVLKPGSRLRYAASFKGDKRDVYLQGEAFFEVTKDPAHPFLVHTGEIVAKVLGTSFLVKENPLEGQIRVIVSTGQVSVSAQPQSPGQAAVTRNEVMLKPNQQAIFYQKEIRLVKDTVQQPSVLSSGLVDRQFNFVQTPISEALDLLEKVYGVNIAYNKASLATCKLTASLSDRPLYDKLTIMCKAVDAHFELVEDTIVIEGNGCQPSSSPSL